MISTRIRRTALAVTAAALLPLAVTGCSGDSGKSSDGKASAPKSSKESKPKQNTADGEFGPACKGVPKSGKGSFKGMAQDPVATAASNNPDLSTLVSAVKKAGLVDTLNSAKNITVFAPNNEAFSKIPKAQLQKVLSDKKTLTKILTYHVVGRPVSKAKLADGSYPTLEKSKLTTSGSGDAYKVNGKANVGCGNIKTANATVHVIDDVLMPPK